MDIKTAFISTRPWSFSMTFSSVTVGSLLAALAGHFDILLYIIVLAGMVAFHAATNVLNDFYDVRHGVDKEGAPTTKYRLHPAAFGQTSLSTILQMSLALYAVTLLAGTYLAATRGLPILLILGAGILGSVLYTADPVVLKARALGEATVFAMWGLLVPLGAYMVQTESFAWPPVLVSVPIGILVALVLLANNIRDIDYDGSVRTKTIAVALGPADASKLYVALLALTYVYVAAAILFGLLQAWSLLVFLTIPQGIRLSKMFEGAVPDNADPQTARMALVFAIIYMASLVLSLYFPLRIPQL